MPHSAIHHVTAIAGPANRNLDFTTRVLGLRLVKRTVNFDDPTTPHLYYGDETGRPGSILTFFPWARAARGRAGIGETQETMLRVPEGSIGFWAHRLLSKGVEHETPTKRFGETVLTFRDPDGTRLSLVGSGSAAGGRAGADVPPEHGVRGVHGVNLLVEAAEPTGAILEGVFGYRKAGGEGSLTRYRLEGGDLGSVVDVHAAGAFLRGRSGAGSVHHVAFRAAGDAEQAEAVARLRVDHGIEATEQKDRAYFRSVYFREPGGVLFEIATDGPGFAVDEEVGSLGAALRLPPFLEPRRSEIEAVLPALEPAPPAFDAGRPVPQEHAS
jgi:glyoxalase family protein